MLTSFFSTGAPKSSLKTYFLCTFIIEKPHKIDTWTSWACWGCKKYCETSCWLLKVFWTPHLRFVNINILTNTHTKTQWIKNWFCIDLSTVLNIYFFSTYHYFHIACKQGFLFSNTPFLSIKINHPNKTSIAYLNMVEFPPITYTHWIHWACTHRAWLTVPNANKENATWALQGSVPFLLINSYRPATLQSIRQMFSLWGKLLKATLPRENTGEHNGLRPNWKNGHQWVA